MKIYQLIIPNNFERSLRKSETSLLRRRPVAIKYPERLIGHTFTEKIWESCIPEIERSNERILSAITKKANIYAIFVKEGTGNWTPVYVGQRMRTGIRQRLRTHLIKTGGTVSKLAYVKKALRGGSQIGIRCINVEPDQMRTVIEQMIIARNKDTLIWNTHGTNNKKKRAAV
jgi:histone H3/H4